VREVWATSSANRKAGMARLVGSLRDKGALREDLSVEKATDICHALNSHDLYLDLVVASGWNLVAFKAWLYETLCRALLSPAAMDAAEANGVASGLSYAAELPAGDRSPHSSRARPSS